MNQTQHAKTSPTMWIAFGLLSLFCFGGMTTLFTLSQKPVIKESSISRP